MEISYFFRPWNIYCKSLPRRQQLTRIKLDSMTVNELGYAVVRLCREKKVKGYHSLAKAQTFGRLMRLSFSRAVSKTDTRKCWTSNLFKAVADKLTDLEFVWTSEPVRQRWRGEGETLKQPYLWKPAGRRRQFYLTGWLHFAIDYSFDSSPHSTTDISFKCINAHGRQIREQRIRG